MEGNGIDSNQNKVFHMLKNLKENFSLTTTVHDIVAVSCIENLEDEI